MRRVAIVLAMVFMQVWQLPQNLLGLVFGWFLKGKQTYPTPPVLPKQIRIIGSEKMYGAISLGNFIYGRTPLYKTMVHHEYGHCRQSRILGPFYLLVIGLPSLLWALMWHPGRRRGYYEFYTERWADRLGGVKREPINKG